MTHNDQEIELKVQITDIQAITTKLDHLGASFLGTVNQEDHLFNSHYFDFAKTDEALRLRIQTNQAGEQTALLTYKGSPTHTKAGNKVRQEFETVVTNPEVLAKILTAVRFTDQIQISKIRRQYKLGSADIAIDETKFGTFLEIEAEEREIERLRKLLGLEHVKPIPLGYAHLQRTWEKQQLPQGNKSETKT